MTDLDRFQWARNGEDEEERFKAGEWTMAMAQVNKPQAWEIACRYEGDKVG